MTDRAGYIVSIRDGIAAIRIERASACSACGTRSVCSAGKADQSLVFLPVTAGEVGDHVLLRLPEGGLMRAALLAYLLPALMTLFGGLLLAAAGDLAAVAGALSGLGLGLLVLRHISRHRTGCDQPAVLPATEGSPLYGTPTFSKPIGEAT